MRWVWTMLSLIVLAGIAMLVMPAGSHSRGDEASSVPEPLPAAATPRTGPAAMTIQASPATDTTTQPASSARDMASLEVAAPVSTTFQPESLPDGTARLDGRFIVSGSGSEQDPLAISWALLASASESIEAGKGRTTPPPHIAFLNGQWIRISAFLAPPLWGERTSELLVMRNRWDGCCIGLPPTPFDCIEATLTAPITLGARHSISFGTVRGRLVVEPFAAGSFLIGLYRLESAQLDDLKPQ